MTKRISLFLAILGPALSGAAAADNPAPSRLLPARVLLEAPHGAVTRTGVDYRFVFNRAPAAEIVDAIGRIWGVALAYAGPSPVTVDLHGPDPESVLRQWAARDRLEVDRQATVWMLRAPAPSPGVP